MTVEVIPPHCTPYCQPCDVYFFRQVKNFIKKIQNRVEVLQNDEYMPNKREDGIKIHSLIHHQLCAPIFKPMILYTWFSSKVISKIEEFVNVNQVCFPNDTRREKCDCQKVSFIRCALCKIFLCFWCFYEKYHACS